MDRAPFALEISSVPAGPWAVGVSGGADSVALLTLLRSRADLAPHVVHLDHETRGPAGAGDADFVRDLAERWGMACTVARRSEVEPGVSPLSANPSAKYRALRIALFRSTVARHGLRGVILGHHADDQAETVLHRLLRGSGPMGLGGMREQSVVGGLVVCRPLLGVRREALRHFLGEIGQTWREDASNASDQYLRNRLRRLLAERAALSDELLRLGEACRGLGDWVRACLPPAGEHLAVRWLRDLPGLLAHEAARQWLVARGAPAGQLSPAVLGRLTLMAADAASPARQSFPGGILVRRRAGKIFVDAARDTGAGPRP